MPRVSATEKRLRRALASNVLSLRGSRGWTLEEAAHRTGVHWRHLQKIEAGEVGITLRTLAKLVDGFDVGLEALLGSTHPSPSQKL